MDRNELPVIVNKLFLAQRSLEVLDFSHNRLARIPEMAFQNLNNLTFLDVSYNKLKIIEENCFRSLVNLHTLNISGNIHLEFDLLQGELEVSGTENLMCLYHNFLPFTGVTTFAHIIHG